VICAVRRLPLGASCVVCVVLDDRCKEGAHWEDMALNLVAATLRDHLSAAANSDDGTATLEPIVIFEDGTCQWKTEIQRPLLSCV